VIDPDFLDELARFEAALDRVSTAPLRGEQDSPAVGEGLTFSDFRRYAPGDDTRLIDWKLYARTDEFYIKQFEEERNLVVHVLLDASGSMDFGEGDANKFDYAAKLGLGFAHLAVAEHNDIRFATVRDGAERIDGGRSSRGEVLALLDRCNETVPAGESDLEAVLESYADTIGSRSLVVVASDFIDDPDAIEAGLAALADNDLVLAHVVAPGEREPPARGDAVVTDPESSASERTYLGGRRRTRYRERLDDHAGRVAEIADSLGARHEVVPTEQDFFDGFASVWFD
jgi:uncharacterized protein (DUF58 family)